MKVHLLTQSYNTLGGHSTLSRIGEFLEKFLDEELCGVRLLEARAHFPSARPPKKSLESSYLRFHSRLTSLPSTRFERKKARLLISYLSKLGPAEDVLKPAEFSEPLFQTALDEFLKVVESLEASLARTPGLKYTNLLSGIRVAHREAVEAGSDLPQVIDSMRSDKKEELAKLPWWKRIGIDWAEYHPSARELLNEEFFWSEVDEYSPHGNDTGADLLAGFVKWRRSHLLTEPQQFLDVFLAESGMVQRVQRACSRQPEQFDRDDRIAVITFDQAAIALAFAQIKTDGCCAPAISLQAETSIERQLDDQFVSNLGISSRPERRTALVKLQSKLREFRTS